jgi:hypothetical protein
MRSMRGNWDLSLCLRLSLDRQWAHCHKQIVQRKKEPIDYNMNMEGSK